MVNLHRWLKKTSPHLVIAGSLVITGLSGCRTAQYTAVELESAPATYPAPLTAPESLTASDADGTKKELILEAPAPPLADSGSNSGTGSPPKLPVPELETPRVATPTVETPAIATSEEPTTKELTQAKPQPEGVPKETASTDAASEPLDESTLFPADNPNSAEPTVDTKDGSDVAVTKPAVKKETDSPVKYEAEFPFVETFEPIVANPELPIPNPGGKPATVTKPETALTPVTPLKSKPTEEPESTSGATSKLFPPPKTKLALPEVKSATTLDDDSAEFDNGKIELPATTPRIEVETKTPEQGGDDSASLPVITPATVATKIKPTIALDLPLPQSLKPTQPELTTSIDKPEQDQDQLASIAKPDGKLPSLDAVKSEPAAKPLTPKASPQPTKTSVSQDAVSVVAEVWSPAENVVFDNSGNAFVSHGEHISKVSSDGTVEPWATMGSPRGHVILPDGSHLVADAGQRAIVKLNEAGEQVRKVATRSDGYFLRAPNDLVADSRGGVYFTDPGYARIRNPIGRIHYVAADGSVTVVAQSIAFPEGIALSADGSKLLVVESQASQVIAFEILSPGEVGPKQVFAELQADSDSSVDGFANGLVVDSKTGRIFVAHGERQRVEMLSPEGKLLRSYDLGAAANGIAFKSGDTGRIFATGGARSGKKDAGQLFEIRIDD
jgi:gluconolactonase